MHGDLGFDVTPSIGHCCQTSCTADTPQFPIEGYDLESGRFDPLLVRTSRAPAEAAIKFASSGPTSHSALEPRILHAAMFPIALLLLFLLPLVNCDADDECQPGFADTCFTSVTDDLKYMLNLKEMTAVNVSMEAVHDLCLALDDSLNCTTDIIESDCESDDGRGRFEAWVRALRGAYAHLCRGTQHPRFKKLLQAIPCWSLEDFVLCWTEDLKMTHVQDLLHTEINAMECKKIHGAMKRCNKMATVSSCREQEDVSVEVNALVQAFFAASDCRPAGPPAGRATSSALSSAAALAMLLLLLVSL
ncbi:uncharacterized protein CDAR_275651 [Caerostris darwini]|uniref:Secreted protein n=1 Tax=Caerostris darwini TaxID=1538125 RepID=A0AAV4UMA0_9ARAC|nr:uncharacterized protein CDAR_275651 [Caerostris darwini]